MMLCLFLCIFAAALLLHAYISAPKCSKCGRSLMFYKQCGDMCEECWDKELDDWRTERGLLR